MYRDGCICVSTLTSPKKKDEKGNKRQRGMQSGLKNSLVSLATAQETIDCAQLIEELQSVLGKKLWIRYAQLITLFVLGKRSRKELIHGLRTKIIDVKTQGDKNPFRLKKIIIRLHNRLLLSILGNSLRLSKLGSVKTVNSSGFNLLDDDDGESELERKQKQQDQDSSEQLEKLKQQNSTMDNYKKIVMSLPQFDRIRLSKILKESGKRGFVVSRILQTRLNTIPKIPFAITSGVENLFQNITQRQVHYKEYGVDSLNTGNDKASGGEQDSKKRGNNSKQKNQPGSTSSTTANNDKDSNTSPLANNNINGMVKWSQDIADSYQVSLSQELYSLPDNKNLMQRMYGLMRENGLIGELDSKCVELMIIAVENYLKNVIENGIDSIRYRKKKYSDLYDLAPSGIYQELSTFSSTTTSVEAPNATAETALDSAQVVPETETVSLTNEDIMDTIQVCPNLLDPGSIYYNMNINYNKNDDELVVYNSIIDDLPIFENIEDKPSFIPIDERNEGSREELNWLLKDILEQR